MKIAPSETAELRSQVVYVQPATAPMATEALEAEALIREAHRRKRRRRLVIASVIVAVMISGGLVALNVARSSGPSGTASDTWIGNGPLPPRSDLGQILLFTPVGASADGAGNGYHMQVIHPAIGVVDAIDPFTSNPALEIAPTIVGDDIVVVDAGQNNSLPFPGVGTAVAFAPSNPTVLKRLGRADYVVNASTPGAVWLVVGPDSGPGPGPNYKGCSTEEVALSGRVLRGPFGFPCTLTIEGPAPDGLIVTVPWVDPLLISLEEWNPAKHKLVAKYSAPTENLVLDADNGNTLFWNTCVDSDCPEQVTNLVNRRRVAIPVLPKGWNLGPQTYAISPNGAFVAVLGTSDATLKAMSKGPYVNPPCCYYGVTGIRQELFVYSVRTEALVERRPLVAASSAEMQFSADSGFLFVTRDLSHIEAVPLWSPDSPIKVSSVPQDGISGDTPAESFIPVETGR